MVFGAIFDKIKKGLSRTRNLFSGITPLFRLRGRVEKEFLQKLEERLYLADVGSTATVEIVERVRRVFSEELRTVRAVQALEYIGTEAAKGLLRTLAGGAPGARATEDAQAALQRLSR